MRPFYSNEYLAHHGILGMKWGVRRYQPYGEGGYDPKHKGRNTGEAKRRAYRSTSLSSMRARRQNEKIDKSFRQWKENTAKKEDAIEIGKQRNIKRMEYESDRSNKEKKAAYKASNKEYKRALRDNTTWRKGDIKKEVGSDLSRKYLSKAKEVEKQLKTDPNNRELAKQYNDLMNRHDVERARARNAPAKAQKASYRKAGLKRSLKATAAGAGALAITAGGAYALQKYGGVTLNNEAFSAAANVGKKILKAAMRQ